jgi:ribosome modulation factor
MTTPIERTAYLEGQKAYIEGKPVKMLPYPKLSEQGASWMRGWHTALFGEMLSKKQNLL